MGCKMIALKRTGTDRIMTGIDMISFVRILKWVCIVNVLFIFLTETLGWSGGAMVLGKLPVLGRPAILITVGQGPIALAVGASRGGLDIFTLIYLFSSFSLSLGDGPI